MKTALLAFAAALSLGACAGYGEGPNHGAVAYYYGPSARIPTPAAPHPGIYTGGHYPGGYASIFGNDPIYNGQIY